MPEKGSNNLLYFRGRSRRGWLFLTAICLMLAFLSVPTNAQAGWQVLIPSVLLLSIGALLGARYALTSYNRTSQALPNSPTRLHLVDKALTATSLELEEIAERYRVLTENLAAAVIIRRTDGTISYCSPYTEVLTGYPLVEIYGAKNDFFAQIIHEDDRKTYERALRVSAYGEPFQCRYRFFHRTGLEMWAETRTVPVLDDNGQVVSSLAITLDVTGSVLHQQQIEEKNRDLYDFSYMVSHDLKAPIFTVKGMVGILREDYQVKLPKEFGETLDHIGQAADRLEQLVGSVLQYSRVSSHNAPVKATDPIAVLKEVEAEYGSRLSECQGKIKVEGKLPLVMADELRLYQIFSNLIGNAVKYRSPARPLTIEVGEKSTSRARTTVIYVRDNGLGIPADKIETIFRPFQRAHGAKIEGSGIGLACVRKVLEKLGGTVSVESKEGVGSTFYVTLRSADDKNAKALDESHDTFS